MLLSRVRELHEPNVAVRVGRPVTRSLVLKLLDPRRDPRFDPSAMGEAHAAGGKPRTEEHVGLIADELGNHAHSPAPDLADPERVMTKRVEPKL